MFRLLVCHGNGEAAGGGSLAVLLPDFREVFAQRGGVDAGRSDGFPSDLECARRDGVGISFGHMGLDRVLDDILSEMMDIL